MQDSLRRIIEESGRNNPDKANEASDAETLQRLESLGYIGGGIEEDFTFESNKEDPKDLVDYHVRMMAVGFYIQSEKYELAQKECEKLIADRPSYFRPWFALGKMASVEEKYDQTVDYLGKSIELNPEHVQSHQGLAVAYEKLGKPREVMAQCARILEIRPNHVEAYFKLSKLLYEKGDFDAPLKYQNADLLQHPSYVEAAITLAKKLLEKKQVTRSFAGYKQILQLDPDSVEVLNALAWMQGASAMHGITNPSEAIRLAERACQLTDYQTPEVLDTLAVAYAAAGNYAKALQLSRKAVTQAQKSAKLPLAARIGSRMDLYKRNQPYRDPSIRE